MLKTKFFATLLIVLAVLFVQVGGVLAAPAAQDTTPIEGTVTGIVTETVDGVTTVLVTVKDALGVEQTYRLSVEDADALDLVIVDTNTNTVTVDESKVNQPITLDPALVIEEEVVDEEPINPVAGMLATFFDITNAEVNQMHEDGFGFGVIAQALWMSTDDDGNTYPDLAGEILTAKQDKDFDTFFENHPEYLEELGGEAPSNWGQFKKALADKKENLGSIMSGHADNDGTGDANTQEKGNGKDKNKDKDKDKGKGKNK